jgi:hypothetical protein
MYVSWLVGPALQITLLALMVRRKLHTAFPRFFSYILFQIVKSAVLFVTFRYFSHDNYFDAYWTGNAISVFFAVLVMDEILHSLFKQYGGIQTLGSTIFRWSCGLLLLLAIVGAFSGFETSADRAVAAVLSFERSVRLMQCGLFLLLMLLCRILKHCWRQPVFGIALGFGVFASIELILVSIASVYGDGAEATISLVKSVAYNSVTFLWIGYLSREIEAVPVFRVSPQVNALNLALASSHAAIDDGESFISMVEQVVDRVLSRQTWPKPPANGSQVVGRKPGPEESN